MTEMKHRIYGGSSAERTVLCPGWVQQSADIPEPPESEYAAEGTALHGVMEHIIIHNLAREDIKETFEGCVHDGYPITAEHVNERILPAFDAWQELKARYKLTDWEPEVECSYAKDIGGYSDLLAVNNTCDVFVIDWKFGFGILVDPVNSHQGRFYGMAARKKSVVQDFFDGAKRLHVVIIQPNDRDAPVLKEWVTTIDALDEYEKVFLSAVDLAQEDDPELHAGNHCKWCPAAATCPEKSGRALWALQYRPDDLEQLANNLSMVKELSEWIRAVESAAISQLEVGAEVPGWKLVAKRAVTKWLDEAVTIKKLARKFGGKKNIVKESVLSPAQILKLAKTKGLEVDIEPLVSKESSGHTLAPADDKREAVVNPRTLAAGLAAIS